MRSCEIGAGHAGRGAAAERTAKVSVLTRQTDTPQHSHSPMIASLLGQLGKRLLRAVENLL